MSTERAVSRVLFLGGIISVALLVIGLAIYVVAAGRGGATIDLQRALQHQQQGRPPGVYSTLGEIGRGLTHRPLEPLAVIALGLVLLAATPVVGVAVAIVGLPAARQQFEAELKLDPASSAARQQLAEIEKRMSSER